MPAPQARLKPAWKPPEDPVDTIAAGRRAAKIEPAANKEPVAAKKVELIDPRVLVLGSYGKRANATRAALKWREMGATIVPSRVGAATLYRVVSAPVAAKDTASELRRIRSIGVKGAWALRLCGGNDAKSGACVSLRASAAE
jgi:cell division protein FtsN